MRIEEIIIGTKEELIDYFKNTLKVIPNNLANSIVKINNLKYEVSKELTIEEQIDRIVKDNKPPCGSISYLELHISIDDDSKDSVSIVLKSKMVFVQRIY